MAEFNREPKSFTTKDKKGWNSKKEVRGVSGNEIREQGEKITEPCIFHYKH